MNNIGYYYVWHLINNKFISEPGHDIVKRPHEMYFQDIWTYFWVKKKKNTQQEIM